MKPEKGKDKEVPGPADTETPGAVEVFDPEVTCEWPEIRWDAKETCVCICRSMSRYLNFADPTTSFPSMLRAAGECSLHSGEPRYHLTRLRCGSWFHFGCCGMQPDDERLKQENDFFCPPCEKSL